MKQVLIRRGQVMVENVPAPVVEPGHVLVEVAYSLISAGTEISNVQSSGKSLIQRGLEQPDKVLKVLNQLRSQGIEKTVARVRGQLDAGMPTGYSCSGVVVQVGRDVTDLQPGERVACAGAGIANHAEMVLAPRNLLVKVPDGCDLKAAASVTLGAIAMQGVRRADPRLGESVAVIGLGLLGQITVQLLKAAGCYVIGVDLDPRRVALASQSGADHGIVSSAGDVQAEIRQLTEGHGVDSVIITAASPSDAIAQQAMEITRKKGRVVVVGAVGLGLQRSPFYEKELDFLISCSYGPGRYDERYEQQGLDYPYAYVRWTENRNLQEYLRLIARGMIKLDSVLEREYPIEQADAAFAALQTGTDKPLGILLRYGIDGSTVQGAKQATRVNLQSIPSDGRVRLAVIGAGGFARDTLLPFIKKLATNVQLRAIVSGTGSNAHSVAGQFGAAYATTNLDDVLNDPEIDAVLIATRHNLHAQQVVAALKAGKHVYCEKPLALTEAELATILACYGYTLNDFTGGQTPTTSGSPMLSVGFNRRFSPAVQAMKALTQQRHSPMMLLYRVNAGYLPPEHWVHGAEGGGRLIGEGCHMIDLFQALVQAPLLEVCVQSLLPKADHILATDNLTASLKYADGSVATLLYTALGSPHLGKEYLEVHLEGQTLVLDDFTRLSLYKGQNAKVLWQSAKTDKGHLAALQTFFSTVAAQGAWPIPLHELVEVSRATFQIAAVESAAT